MIVCSASSHGHRSPSSSGSPRAIFAMLASGWWSSASTNCQPSATASAVPTVVLPLTAAGLEMGERFADAYGSLRWRAIVTSTRRRTVTTAEPLASRCGVQTRRDGRLDEMFFGDWQGLTKREAAARDPARYARWRQDPTVGAPGGDSPFDVSARALAAIDDLRTRYDSGNVLVVSHKTVLRLLLCRLLNVDLRRYRDVVDWPTGAVTLLELGPCQATARFLADEG